MKKMKKSTTFLLRAASTSSFKKKKKKEIQAKRISGQIKELLGVYVETKES